jgi:hypothetical protein
MNQIESRFFRNGLTGYVFRAFSARTNFNLRSSLARWPRLFHFAPLALTPFLLVGLLPVSSAVNTDSQFSQSLVDTLRRNDLCG